MTIRYSLQVEDSSGQLKSWVVDGQQGIDNVYKKNSDKWANVISLEPIQYTDENGQLQPIEGLDPSTLDPGTLEELQGVSDKYPIMSGSLPKTWYEGDGAVLAAPIDESGQPYLEIDGQKTYLNNQPTANTDTGTNTGTGAANTQTSPSSSGGSATQDTSASTPDQTTQPTIGTGTGTEAGSGDNLNLSAPINYGAVPTLFPSLSGNEILDEISNRLNEASKAAYEGTNIEYKTNSQFNFQDVFDAEAGTTFDFGIGESPFASISGNQVTKEELLQNKDFNIAHLNSVYNVNLKQPLQNYEALTRSGVPLQNIVVNPLPKQTPINVQELDVGAIVNASQPAQPASAQAGQINEIPNQTETDVTGGSGQ